MRRKLFCTLMSVMAVLFLLDFIGIPLRDGGMEGLIGQNGSFTGKIVKIQYKDENKFHLEVEVHSVNGRRTQFRDNLLVTYYNNWAAPWEYFNEVISFNTEIKEAAGQRNPHCFNYKKYLRSRGINAVASVSRFAVIPTQLTLKEKYEKWLFRQRCLFEKELSAETKGIVIGMLFGDTSYLDEEVYEDFKYNGTAHILAVSGLHVGILYGLYQKTAGRSNSRAGLVLLAIMLFSYGTLAMWSPSVTRAALMIGMSITARLLDLRYDMLTAMSAVALILIILNPYVIFGAGFQMSFLAITSIAFLRPHVPHRIPDFLAAPLTVYIGLLPYQIYQFNFISLVSVAANLPVVFLAGYFVPFAVLAFVIFIISGSFGIMKPALEGLAVLIMEINKFSTLEGHGTIEVMRPPLWLTLFVGGVMFFLASETFTILKLRKNYRKISACMGAIISASIICGVLAFSPVSQDHIVFVDVGQGDCIHIREGKTDILIDGGGSISYNVGEQILKPYLMRNGAEDVDAALATHLHMDHYKGLEELSEIYNVKKIMTEMTAGMNVQISDNLWIQTLWPETISAENGQEENSSCSVFLVNYCGYRILITGDIDEAGEKSMIKKYAGTGMLKADILKIGHHGSSTSTCSEFLEQVSPDYAVIQVGKNNYGHPDAEVIEKCRKKGIIVLRNDYNGAIGFSFGKKGITSHVMIDRKD